jgi:Amt family ammonium transporter
MTIVFFNILKRTIGMRSDTEAEISGLDMPEMGAMAYPDFLEAQGAVFLRPEDDLVGAGPGMAPVSAASLREEVAR